MTDGMFRNADPGDNVIGPDCVSDFFGNVLHDVTSMPNNLECVKPTECQLRAKDHRRNLAAMPTNSEKPYSDIGERLRWHRDLLNVDQADYVKPLLAVKRSAYSNWEAGSSRLSLNGALEIRETYGLSLDFLYAGIDDALPMTLRNAWRDSPRVNSSK